jgi:hypothetical protein
MQVVVTDLTPVQSRQRNPQPFAGKGLWICIHLKAFPGIYNSGADGFKRVESNKKQTILRATLNAKRISTLSGNFPDTVAELTTQ